MTPRRPAALHAALATLACVALAGPVHAEVLWTLDTGSEIVFQRLTPLGTLLVSTERDFTAIDPATGRTLWSRADVKKLKECNYDEIHGSPLGLLDLGEGVAGVQRHIEVIDLTTGAKKWDSEALPMNSSQGVFAVGAKKMLLVAGAPKKGTRTVFCGVDVETGALRWQQDALFTQPIALLEVRGSGKVFRRYSIEGHQPPVYDTDDTAILYLSEEGPIKIDLNTGRKLWTADKLKGREVPVLRNGYAGIALGEGVAFVPYGKSLMAIDLASGAPAWKTDQDFKSKVTQMALTPRGLVVRGEPGRDTKGKPDGKPFVDCLDPKTGASRWRKPFKDMDGATSFDVKGDHLFIAADGELFAIDLASGAATSVTKIQFKGKEAPATLEVRGDDYVLSSSQNVMRIDARGSVKYHTFLAPPAQSGWIKVLSTAAVMATHAASATSAHSPAASNPGTTYRYQLSPNPELSRRLEAAAGAHDYAAIQTTIVEKGNKGSGLVKVSKEDGTEAARCWLGDQSPEYELDAIDGRVFLKKTDQQIVCYKF
jgi:outer membrane protein assembly factor BamB